MSYRIEFDKSRRPFYYDENGKQRWARKGNYRELKFESDLEYGGIYYKNKLVPRVKEIIDFPGTARFIISDDGRVFRITQLKTPSSVNLKGEWESYSINEVYMDNGRIRIQDRRVSRNKLWKKYWPDEYSVAHPSKKKPQTIVDDLPEEEWKEVPNTNGFYVSNKGRVKFVNMYAGEKISSKIHNKEGKELSKFMVFKDLWDLDIVWEGDLDDEEWKKIPYADDIEVSNKGRIRTTDWKGTGTKKLMKTWKLNGYIFCNFIDNTGNIKKTPIHRLIAECFVPNPSGKPEIDHINTQRDDNRPENLRWVSHGENMRNPITKKNMSAAQKLRFSKGK